MSNTTAYPPKGKAAVMMRAGWVRTAKLVRRGPRPSVPEQRYKASARYAVMCGIDPAIAMLVEALWTICAELRGARESLDALAYHERFGVWPVTHIKRGKKKVSLRV
jgi:hypothetical protein